MDPGARKAGRRPHASSSAVPAVHSIRPALLVAVAALAASIAGIANQFAWDDVQLIERNTRVHGFGAWREILSLPYWPPPWNQEHYRPLTSFFSAFQYVLGGGGALVFRVTSYLLYAATAVGVLALAQRAVAGKELRAQGRDPTTPRPWQPAGASVIDHRSSIPLVVALLFAAHPVHVEAVAAAVGQSELLVALFGLLMVIRYVDLRREGRLGPRDWALLGALYAAACLAKEHGFALPGLLVAAEATLLRGPLAVRLRLLWPGFAALTVVAAILVLARFLLLGGTFSGQWTAEALEGVGLGGRALTALALVPLWLRLLVWPTHLQLDYAPQELTASAGFGATEALGLATIVAAVTAGWVLRHRAPAVPFGVAWMAVALGPVSNVLVPAGTITSERLLFLPSVGFVIALGGLAQAVAIARTLPQWMIRGSVAGVALLTLAGVARSTERHRVWRHDGFLAVRTVQDAPRSYRAWRAYGNVLFDLGERNLAIAAFDSSLALAPPLHAWRVRNDLARRFRELGETEAEVDQLRASLDAEPHQEDSRGHLIAALLLLGRYDEAAREADAALAYLPVVPEVFHHLRQVADSVARTGAPAGSVRVRIGTTPTDR